MAVEDKYVVTQVVSGVTARAVESSGTSLMSVQVDVAVDAADDDGSVYRLFKNMNPDIVIHDVRRCNGAVTGGTDYDIGIYESEVGGAAKDADKLADGISMASAIAIWTSVLGSGTNGRAASEINEKLHELAGDAATDKLAGYDVALTANTVGSATETIAVQVFFSYGAGL